MWAFIDNVKNKVETMIEEDKATFLSSDDQDAAETQLKLPWECVDSQHASLVQQLVRALAQDRRNFVEKPTDSEWISDVWPRVKENNLRVAEKLLPQDKVLNDRRWDLVPGKVSEDHFWRNYFWRVTLIVEAHSGALPARVQESPQTQQHAYAEEAELVTVDAEESAGDRQRRLEEQLAARREKQRREEADLNALNRTGEDDEEFLV